MTDKAFFLRALGSAFFLRALGSEGYLPKPDSSTAL